MKNYLLAAALLLHAASTHAQVVNSTWLGDGTGNFNNGNFSNSAFWNPAQVPNNNGGTLYDVTIPFYDGGAAQFNGPEIDISPTVRNLTLVNRVFLDNQANVGTNLTVTGTTSITTAPGHDGETAALFEAGGTWFLGTLTNYNASTHTLTGPFFYALRNATIGWRGADVITNNSTLFLGDATTRFVDQNTNQNALRNLAFNMGGIEFGSGINFTTAGNLTNDGSLSVVTGAAGQNTVFTVSGNFTNFDAPTKTLSGGYLSVEVRDAVAATSTLRFANADIRNINGATVHIVGAGASIQDLAGQNALRNLSGINGGSLTNGGTLTITPSGGTFTNDGGTHEIDTGAHITIQGNQQVINGGTVRIGAPTDNGNTVLTITGNSVINGGSSLDMGGQPGVNTQYHTELRVMNGIEFRGSYLTGTGTTFADVGLIQGSVFAPGHSPGQQTVQGAISFDSSTFLLFQIGGLSAGDGFDQLVQQGTSAVTLGGTLDLSFVDGFENAILHSDTFDIVTSDNNLTGTFSNVASGGRLATSDGLGSFKVTYANQKTVSLSDFQPTLRLVSAVERETHGARGDFDLPLNLTGSPTIDSRAVSTHHIVLTFSTNIDNGTFTIDAPAGGEVTSASFSGQTVVVNLSGVTNAQLVTLHMDNVIDEYSQELTNASFQVGYLIGDVNGDRTVNAADATGTRNRSGQQTDATNFLTDVNLDGSVNSADATLVRARSGTGIGPQGQPLKERRAALR
ncbi:MAG: dockerin type I repeat-containing protein [Verrucomicrobiota bacterium]|nr:dockerin type I repeat-containing protein [Verrucomicrobiota bacterium]